MAKLQSNISALKTLLHSRILYALCALFVVFGVLSLYVPTVIVWKQGHQLSEPAPFPVTVDPIQKTITEDPAVEAMFARDYSTLSAAAIHAGDFLDILAERISATPLYQLLAAADAPKIVLIYPGYRKEEAAHKFGKMLGWDKKGEVAFLESLENTPPYLLEGNIAPGAYTVLPETTSGDASSLVSARFFNTILSRYATSTKKIVPLLDALTIASIIERETSDTEEMRVISGIIWNRIFIDMKLQIDSTLQYAKGTSARWWPAVQPQDMFIASLYNTYLHTGLPPAPIANPSVAAVLAALNPKKTDCFFYFHRSGRQFHCSATYAEHVALLKKYYGRGK
ncbi:MAG TPA: endolytic transglycosylase MltG [Candidatus Paceibacterota bacterium]